MNTEEQRLGRNLAYPHVSMQRNFTGTVVLKGDIFDIGVGEENSSMSWTSTLHRVPKPVVFKHIVII